MDKSIGIVDDWFSEWFINGGLDEVVLVPLIVLGLTLRLESLSPVSSSPVVIDRINVFSPLIEFVSSSSLVELLVVDTSFSILVELWSFFEGGASGILNDLLLVVELGVTVIFDPRRFPLRKIRSLGSCGVVVVDDDDEGVEVLWWSRWWLVLFGRISDLYLLKKKKKEKVIHFHPVLTYRGGAQLCSVVFNNAPT